MGDNVTDDRLHSVELKLERLTTVMEQKLERQDEFNERVIELCQSNHEAIHGNGKPGLKEKVGLMADRQGRRDKWLFASGITAIGLAIHEAWKQMVG